MDIENLKDPQTVKSTLSQIIKYTFETEEEQVTSCVQKLLTDINLIPILSQTPHQSLALRLNEQYENDVGIIVSFLLNYMVLQPGEALVLNPNEPHAYLKGEGLECMATSDNVVRGGLTPKLKHAKVLVDMLTYETGPITPFTGDSKSKRGHVVYNSGFEEFSVVKLSGKADQEPMVYTSQNPGILICLSGSGNMHTSKGKEYKVDKFDTFYCLPGEELSLTVTGEE